jgi:hypothetical protein
VTCNWQRQSLHKRITEFKAAFLRSAGALLQVGALVALIGMVPYTVFAAYELYRAVSSFAGNPVGSLLYAIARCSGCILLIYALWRLRQAGLRMRNTKSS